MRSTPITPDLVRGAVELEPTEHGLLPHRLPAWARAQVPDDQLAQAESQPSGVRLVFRTTATALELDVLATKLAYVGAPPRPDGVYDLVVDGRLAGRATADGGNVRSIDMADDRRTLRRPPPPTMSPMPGPPATDGRRTAAAARRRAREAEIVAATRQLFDDSGVREANIDDIARAVGVNRAIVYRHFTGKEDLFALTMVGYLTELAELLDAASGEASTPESRVTAIVTTFADYALAHPAFLDCAQALMRRPGSELLDEVSERALLKLGGGMASCLGSLSDAIEEGVAAGDFRVKDATLLANTLYASGLGALMLARSGLVIRESAPGIPVVGEISPEQVKQHMVATALAAARGQIG